MELVLPQPRLDDQSSTSCKSWQHLKKRFRDSHLLKQEDQPFSDFMRSPMSSSLLMHLSGNKIRDIMKPILADVDEKVDAGRIDSMFERIEDLCIPRFILLYERFKFFTLKQKESDDDIQTFISKLQMLADYCELGEHLEKYIVGRIINGVHSKTLQKYLQKAPDLDIQKILEICNKGGIFNCGKEDQSSSKKGDDANLKKGGDSSSKKGGDSNFKKGGDANSKKKGDSSSKKGGDANSEKGGDSNSKKGGDSNLSKCELGCLKDVEKVVKNGMCLLRKKNGSKACAYKRGAGERKTKLKRRVGSGVSVNRVVRSDGALPAEPLLRQTRSRTIAKQNNQHLESLRRDRSLRSQSKSTATVINSEHISPENHTDSDGTDYSPTIPVSDENGGVTFPYIPEITLNEFYEKSVPEKSGNDIQQLENLGNKSTESEGLSQDMRTTEENFQTDEDRKSRKCPICGLLFMTMYTLKCHIRTHSEPRLYRCSFCEMGFKHCGSRSRHMRQAHPELLKFSCTECDMTFERQKALDQHKLSHSKDREMACEDCGKTFSSTREHYQHRRREHRNIRYRCDKCGQHFPYPSKLKLHLMSKHNATKPYMCEVCGSSFAEKNMLLTHRNIHTGEKKHKCTTCGQRFLLKTTLSNHIKTHLEGRPHTCEVCGMGFKLLYYLKSHMKTHTTNRERPHVCSKCGAAFLKKAQLHNHERKHTGEKPYKCEMCGSLFSQLSSMKKHVKQIHEGLKPKDRFSCEYCGISFTHSCKLKLHLMKHTGERPFVCKVCGSTYRENHQLTSHMKIHDGSEPFKCHLCGRRFLQKSSLDGHLRKHTGEKPFKCPICSSSFSHKGYLRDHVKVHEENRERKYKCGICEKAFTCSSHMRSHERLHTGEKPHKCDVCGSRFTKRSSVNKHLKRTHGIQNCSSLQDKGSVPAQNAKDCSTMALQSVDVPCQGLHSDMSIKIEHSVTHHTHLHDLQPHRHCELQTEEAACHRPASHGEPSSHIQPLHSAVGPDYHSGMQPHLQPGIYPGIHTIQSHSGIHNHLQQQQHHQGICIVHPDIHTTLHTQVLPEVSVPSLSSHMQHHSVQDLHIYTLTS